MKVVLAHDWLTGFRGGERVLEVFCELFPDAPLYTMIHHPGSTSDLIEDRPIVTSFLNSIPSIEKNYRKFLPLFPMAVDRMVIKHDADILLSSSHCTIKGLKKPKNAKHLSYIHSPMRYIYDQFEVYFGQHAPLYQQWGAKLCRSYLMNWDIESNAGVDVMVANSHFVAHRIKKFYKRDAHIIHPFVELKDFADVAQNPPEKKDYYVMITAFAPNKRVDLAIDCCNQLKKELVIIGSGQEEKRLRSMAGPTIKFLGSTDRATIVETLAQAKAMIFPGVEDFGITPLESLASGTPVIAFRAGGVLETLNDQTAVFFDQATSESLCSAVMTFEQKNFDRQNLLLRAHDFSREAFKTKILNQIENLYESGH